MKQYYHTATNRYVAEGRPFALDEISYPANWLEHATSNDLSNAGLIEVAVVGVAGDERYFDNAETLLGTTLTITQTQKPVVTPSAEQIIAELESAVQSRLNAQAKTRGYDDIKSAALRAGYPGPFHDEGVVYATWMDSCWAHCYQVLAAVQSGNRSIPTASELLAELPVLVLP